MPSTQVEFDGLVNQLRNMGHVLERAPGNIMQSMYPGQATGYFAVPDGPADANTVLMTNTITQPASATAWGPWGPQTGGTTSHGNAQSATIFPTQGFDDDIDAHYDSGTDSDTSSPCGEAVDDYGDLQGMTEEEQGQELFLASETS